MRLHHLAFRTDDLDRLERFYTDVLGLRVLRRDPARSVWLDADGAILMLEARASGEPRTDGASMELICFTLAPDAHGAIAARLAEARVPVEGRTAYTLYFRDPDGRRLGASSYPAPLTPL